MTDLELEISKLDKPHDRVLTLLRAVPESYLSTACICRLCAINEKDRQPILCDLFAFGRIIPLSKDVPISICYWSIA